MKWDPKVTVVSILVGSAVMAIGYFWETAVMVITGAVLLLAWVILGHMVHDYWKKRRG